MLTRSRAAFEEVPDFTVAVEEEFALLDPDTLGLVNRFEELQEAAQGTELEPHLVGELIASASDGSSSARSSSRAGSRSARRARTPGAPGRSSGSSTRRTTASTTRSFA